MLGKFIEEGIELSITRFFKQKFDILGDIKKGTLEILEDSYIILFLTETKYIILKTEVQDPWIFMVTVRFEDGDTTEVFLDPDFNIFWTAPKSKNLCKFVFTNGQKIDIRIVSGGEINLMSLD